LNLVLAGPTLFPQHKGRHITYSETWGISIQQGLQSRVQSASGITPRRKVTPATQVLIQQSTGRDLDMPFFLQEKLKKQFLNGK
jgi:hypothetical protein